jgi:hypothetical protein
MSIWRGWADAAAIRRAKVDRRQCLEVNAIDAAPAILANKTGNSKPHPRDHPQLRRVTSSTAGRTKA